MTTFSIRPLQAADEPQWRALWRDYLAFYGTTADDAVYASSFDRMLSGDEGEFRGLVATRGDDLIGLAHYLFHRHGWRIENVCYLQDLFVAPDARGAGVGEALIRAVYDAADDAGCGGVYWLTQVGNETARRIYDRVGAATDFMKYARA